MALPITEKPQRPSGVGSTHPAFYIACWIFFSNLTILFNKWLIDTAGFRMAHHLIPFDEVSRGITDIYLQHIVRADRVSVRMKTTWLTRL